MIFKQMVIFMALGSTRSKKTPWCRWHVKGCAAKARAAALDKELTRLDKEADGRWVP